MSRLALPQTMAATACELCSAVCCLLTAVLAPEDDVPEHLVEVLPNGDRAMAHDASGWCVALDREQMNCGIYERRPDVCRRFVMNGPYCRALRIDYRRDLERGVPRERERG